MSMAGAMYTQGVERRFRVSAFRECGPAVVARPAARRRLSVFTVASGGVAVELIAVLLGTVTV
jgi:hypothetical protein